jgi:glycosyl transferase family 25
MSTHVPHIFYINLDKRTDRREEIENQLQQFNLYDQAERFPAIHTPDQGILGCTMSHLAVFKLAKERQYPHVLILEDDFYFTVTQDELENELQQFFQANIPFHVLMLSYHIQQSTPTEYPFLQKVIEAQTASGYIVHHSFYDTLINLYEEAVPQLRDTNHHWIWANDQVWKRIQPTTDWYALTTRCGKQRDGYSDNSNKYQTYDV